ncbi:glycosyltransferase [Mucilaginibacter sp.]|uniref:glycosyltransferase n=1 Tax=Mucilaginibacter sp. TaxID=1882438 RepID=UPI003D0BC242
MIAVLHPYVLHYREDFFLGLNGKVPTDIYCYETAKKANSLNHKNGDVKVTGIPALKFKSLILYNPSVFFNKKYDTLVLMLTFTHLTTWLLLLTKPFHRKKIILWGHGISVKRFLKEEKKPNFLLGWMIAMADGIWFYTEHELNLWKSIYPNIKAVSLNNTISDVDVITASEKQLPKADKVKLKQQYGIHQDRIFIYCARFNTVNRRIDLLEEFIKLSDKDRCGFIIIGDGKFKPDFKKYSNVYDFGALYDTTKKSELFSIADIYFQPAWVGLSIVEAMAYGKPIFTFKRSAGLLQCVEYSNIKDHYNGLIFNDVQSMVDFSAAITDEEIILLGNNAKKYVVNNLKMDNMIQSAFNSYKEVAN